MENSKNKISLNVVVVTLIILTIIVIALYIKKENLTELEIFLKFVGFEFKTIIK